MDPLTVLTLFGPLAIDLGRSLISRFIAPNQIKPSTAQEYLDMHTAELAMFNAINNAGGTNSSYPWVEAVIRLQRPAVAIIVLAVWAGMTIAGKSSTEVDNFAAAIGFYLFGDRTLFYTHKNLTNVQK